MQRAWILIVLALFLAACSGPDTTTPEVKPSQLQSDLTSQRASKLPFATGLVANSGQSIDATAELKPPLIRIEFPVGTDPESMRSRIDGYAAEGTRVLLLAGFGGAMPSNDEAAGLGRWAKAFGPASGRDLPVTTIEFGNETSYTYQYDDRPGDDSYSRRAADYARLAVTAANAIKAADSDVGLIAQADDGNTDSPKWVDSMFAAASDLDSHVEGWTIHPYGPNYRDRLSRARQQLSKHGSNRPLWITEWGLANDQGRCLTDNYGWNPCMDATAAGATLLQVVKDLHNYNVAAFLVYQTADQKPPGADNAREHFFGILTNTGQDKGQYTAAVRALWGS